MIHLHPVFIAFSFCHDYLLSLCFVSLWHVWASAYSTMFFSKQQCRKNNNNSNDNKTVIKKSDNRRYLKDGDCLSLLIKIHYFSNLKKVNS